ncbi:MAG: hypothetical protein SGCHY_000577 [Lobulomycetales sp.]
MGGFISQLTGSGATLEQRQNRQEPEDTDASFFAASSQLYFGPHFVVAPAGADGSTSNTEELSAAHFLDPKNALWNEVWSAVASDRTINMDALRESYKSPYASQSGSDISTTLHALVNLRKNTLKLTRSSDGSYKLKFSFDASQECQIRVYCKAKEVVVVDSKTGKPKASKNIIYRSRDNSQAFLKTFGPFSAGLNQAFEIPESELFNLEMFHNESLLDDHEVPAGLDSESQESSGEVPTTSPKGGNFVGNATKNRFTPIVFDFIISISLVGPESLREGLDKASEQGMPNPINSQATYVTLSRSGDSPIGLKIQKQRIVIDSVAYLLQEVYGFLDNEEDATEESRESRDCVAFVSLQGLRTYSSESRIW